MKKLIMAASLVCVFCLPAGAAWLDPPADVKHRIVAPGTYWSSQIGNLSADGWWGIYVDDNGVASMAPAHLILSAEEPLDDMQRSTISAEPGDGLLLLVHGVSGVQAGPVTTRHTAKPGEYGIADGKPLGLGDLLTLTPGTNRDARMIMTLGTVVRDWSYSGGPVITELRCVVAEGDMEQTLLLDEPAEFPPVLLFAGDIDRDGQNDVILQRNHESGASELSLWLSGAAKEGELLGLAGHFMAKGC